MYTQVYDCHYLFSENVHKLMTLGFSREDCILALEISGNKLDEAAIWLTKYASPKANTDSFSDMKIAIDCIEVSLN